MNSKSTIYKYLISILTLILIGETLLEDQFGSLKHNIKNIDSFFHARKVETEQNKNINCLPKKLSKIPNNATVVIGHPYGSYKEYLKNKNGILANNIRLFLDKNRQFISTLILNGDVFYLPSKEKWKRLYKEYRNDFQIYIIPGNHDVGSKEDNVYRDIFNQEVGKYQNIKFPIIETNKYFNYVFNDSTNTQIDYILSNILNNIKNNKKTIIFSHHINIKEMNIYANEYSKYELFKLKNHNVHKKNITFIFGDGGTKNKIACFQKDGIKYLLNGINGEEKDRILIIDKDQIYQYII